MAASSTRGVEEDEEFEEKDCISENVVSLRKFIGLYALVPGSESGKFKKHRKKSYKVCAYGRRLFVFRYA